MWTDKAWTNQFPHGPEEPIVPILNFFLNFADIFIEAPERGWTTSRKGWKVNRRVWTALRKSWTPSRSG
jgi:hypothetical protein